MKTTKFLILFLTINLFTNIIVAQTTSAFSLPPKYEVRAVWLTTIGGLDWPSSYNPEKQKKQLCDILDQLQSANINTVLLQTRIRATTIYPSSYEPFDGCITGHPGQRPNYDPLAFAVEECHKRGMEIHAWVVAIPIGKWNGYGCRQLRKLYPSLVKRIGDEGFMNPEKAETGKYIADICEEIVSKYDVDGIHLDYIRYPETWKKIGNKTAARDNITRIMQNVNTKCKELKRWIKISCAPIGKFSDLTRYSSNGWNAYDRVCQDVQAWMKQGLVDMIFPMMYFRGNNFYPFLLDWKENASDRIVVPGLGIYFMSPNESNWQLDDIWREVCIARSQDMGYALFRTRHFLDNNKGFFDAIKSQHCNYPALIPPMTWEKKQLPDSPTELAVAHHSQYVNISWKGNDNALYNVYASRHMPVNIDDARNLIATRQRNNNITISVNNKNKEKLYFAVTQTDRFGNESKPVYSYDDKEQQEVVDESFSYRLVVDSNNKIDLSHYSQIADIKYVIITDLNGKVIASLRCNKQYLVDVSSIKETDYIVRSVNKKGVSHRLGFVIGRRSLDYSK